MGIPIEVRRLARDELSKVGEIDRSERIDLIYTQRGTELEERRGNWSSPAWSPHGHGELHVSQAFPGTGIGRRLSDGLDLIARDAGDTEMVVSATPSGNTVRFYQRRGYELMAAALPELYEREPEDVHLRKLH